jgi:uncharacterized protein
MEELTMSNFRNIVTTETELQSIVGVPGNLVNNKVINHLDEHCINFVSLSPFCLLSTSDENGHCDVSPRGDKPGFAFVLDSKRIILPERPGNRRVDSMRNIISNPHIGLLFLIPGLGETLRVNGRACLVTDDELLDKMSERNRKPLIGIAIEVEECYIHCAKAFKRSGLWEPESWAEHSKLPSAAKILSDHAKLSKLSTEEIEAILSKDYKERLY